MAPVIKRKIADYRAILQWERPTFCRGLFTPFFLVARKKAGDEKLLALTRLANFVLQRKITIRLSIFFSFFDAALLLHREPLAIIIIGTATANREKFQVRIKYRKEAGANQSEGPHPGVFKRETLASKKNRRELDRVGDEDSSIPPDNISCRFFSDLAPTLFDRRVTFPPQRAQHRMLQ